MATLYEHYNSGDDEWETAHDSFWCAQTFTPSATHKVGSVKLLLRKQDNPGTITVSIRGTRDGGARGIIPGLADLCIGETNGNTLPEWPAEPEWREITLGVGYILEAGTRYAILVRALETSGGSILRWRSDETSATYANGDFCHSDNGDDDWYARSGWDFMFEEWGGPTNPEVTTNPATELRNNSAKLNGKLDDDGGEACDCGFEWGETDAYGETTATESKITGESFFQNITGLSAGTLYHFRAKATNSIGTGYGDDEIFMTTIPSADPTIAPKKVSLELIRNIEMMNTGRFYIDKSGNAVYESRFAR